MPVPPHPPADAATAATWEALRDHTSPSGFTAAVADLLTEHLDLRRPVVDVGAGSGHLMAALAALGALVVALDLSVPMLERLPASLPRVASDAVCLPLRDASAGTAMAAHLLHVVPDWRAAVAELDRVAGPQGVVLVQASASMAMPGPAGRLRAVFRDHLPARALSGNEVAEAPALIDGAFGDLERTAADLPEVRRPRQETGRGVLHWLQGNLWTWPGPTSEAERREAAAAATAWAEAEGLDLDEPFETESIARWRSYVRSGR